MGLGERRLLLMLPYAWDTAPSQRFRIEQWAPWLREEGIRCDVSTLLSPGRQRLLYAPGRAVRKAAMVTWCMLARLLRLAAVRRYDAVWLHRAAWPAGPPLPERLLARLGVPLLYEFDDAIYLPHTAAANRHFAPLKFAAKTAAICRIAREVVVGNRFLAAYASRFNPAVTVIPTTIDTDAYPPRRDYLPRRPAVLGWSGSGTTVPHLRLLDGALQRAARAAEIRLHVLGAPEYVLPGVETRATPWSAAREIPELQAFDIGVMPLPDEEWARGKCALKALQYMALGIPTVASPVGVNAEIIRDGENGFLAASEEEWVEKLLLLARDSSLRRTIGRAGRATVEAEYSASVHGPRVAAVVHRVCEERTPPQRRF